MAGDAHDAPGQPGIPPRWTSSAKTGVGAALGSHSQLWFTLSHGIVNEIFYPRIDRACTRDMGMLVTNGVDYFSEEKRHAEGTVEAVAPGVPAYRLRNRALDGRYTIEKSIVVDPMRPVLLQRTRLLPAPGEPGPLRLHVLLSPHLDNRGTGNTAWVDEYKGVPMLFAERAGTALALASSAPWGARSAGYVGESDGWRDLAAHFRMTWQYPRAESGNVALTAEIVGATDGTPFVLALAFGATAAEAALNARASLADGFDRAWHDYREQWQSWQDALEPLDRPPTAGHHDLYRVSTMVMRVHAANRFPGGMIASLSVPWGFSKGDDDLGGYHLVWPRDLVESAGGLLAAGAYEEARRVLAFLEATQEDDGHWAQNMWLDGTPYWNGVQMDETALPILLVDLAWREGALHDDALARFWPMVRRAAGYLVRNGPVSPQDRWEEDPGYSPFTVATEIAALLAAADFAERFHEPAIATYLRETADGWYTEIDRWMWAEDTGTSRDAGVDGYYVRIAPVDAEPTVSRLQASIPVKNVPAEEALRRACDMVSPDALALVRFGLRRANDPRIQATLAVIDRTLRVETPSGPVWHRYTGDGYGEHVDGSPFDGTGVGRGWPLLTGERAHLELAAGRKAEVERLRDALGSLAGTGGLLPEQSWDTADIPERELFFGRPSGSAMPLVWAHAEYVKLCRSLRDERIFDCPPQTVHRYLEGTITPVRVAWRFSQKLRAIPAGLQLRVEVMARATVHWSTDRWATTHDTPTRDTGLGVHLADLGTAELPAGGEICFTLHWEESGRWEGEDFRVAVEAP